jgi:hypothetical protein
MRPTFMYESMPSSSIFGRGDIMRHPIYELRKSARMEVLNPPEYSQRAKNEKVVFFFIPGNMGGYI